MVMYGADVAAPRTLADQLADDAGELETISTLLGAQVSRATWHEPDGDDLRGRWSSVVSPALSSASTCLSDAATRVRSNADAQETTSTDDDGAGGYPGLGVGSGTPGGASTGSGTPGGASTGSGTPGGASPTPLAAPGGSPGAATGGGGTGDDWSWKGKSSHGASVSGDDGAPGSPATGGWKVGTSSTTTYDPENNAVTHTDKVSGSLWSTPTEGSKVGVG